MFGLPRDRWHSPLIHEALPDLVERRSPGLVYVTSSPSGGDLPFQPDMGVSHYFGVGVYLFPLEDMRRAAPRFAQYIQIDVPGFAASDSWFHLPPGGSRTVLLRAEPGCEHEPKGRLRALNSVAQGSVSP